MGDSVATAFAGRDVISTRDLTREEILSLLDLATEFEGPVPPLLQGRVMASLFFEPSTRTRLSFESAMLRLGGRVLGFAEAGVSSAAKGETLADTVRVAEGYADIIVMRRDGIVDQRLFAVFPEEVAADDGV